MDQNQNTNIEARLEMLEKALKENTDILIRMRSSQRIAMALRALYWIMIFLLGFGALYFVKPYLGQLGAVYGVGGKTDLSNIKGILEEYKATVN
jgi:hypothetical protein